MVVTPEFVVSEAEFQGDRCLKLVQPCSSHLQCLPASTLRHTELFYVLLSEGKYFTQENGENLSFMFEV